MGPHREPGRAGEDTVGRPRGSEPAPMWDNFLGRQKDLETTSQARAGSLPDASLSTPSMLCLRAGVYMAQGRTSGLPRGGQHWS